MANQQPAEQERQYTLKQFLEEVPPGKAVSITDFVGEGPYSSGAYAVAKPRLELHCSTEGCADTCYFDRTDQAYAMPSGGDAFVYYVCRNCGQSRKRFALFAVQNAGIWRVQKYGERPAFGPPTPARAITLIGGERDLFLLGRRCETQGMGIGAFVYYRRVIESQRNRIFDELIRVIGTIAPGDPVLADLEAAKKETQFTTSVDTIKHALPQFLLINGYNPLTLLHSALSGGVHERSDEECLVDASSVRTVLFEFADRLGQALKDDKELKAAVSRLANKK